jgi:hypothetical protein
VQSVLSKRDIEVLLDEYDNDPVGAVSVALRKLIDDHDAPWHVLVAGVPESVASRSLLEDHDISALDAVVKHLVENRRLHH